MKPTEKLKLPDNRKPNVLDRHTIWAAIRPEDYVDDESDKEYIIKTTVTLRQGDQILTRLLALLKY